MSATIVLRPDGTVEDANPDALSLLGVGLDELRALPEGSFSAEEPDPAGSAAFRDQWEREGRPDIGGEATLRRLDGSMVRVRFAISAMTDGRFVAALEPVAGVLEAPSRVFTAGQVLAAWRAAERRLMAVPAGSPEWLSTMSEIEFFRARYQQLFRGVIDGDVRRPRDRGASPP